MRLQRQSGPSEALYGEAGGGLSDRELVARFKRSADGADFELLFERYCGRIYSICYAMVRDRGAAEDLVQETFMKAFQQIDRFDESDPGSCFEAWLCTITRHLCVSELRKLAVRRRETRSHAVVDPPNQDLSVTSAEVDRLLSVLTDPVRRCWLLFKLEGFSYKEIARLTGYSLRQVKHYLETAREKLEKVRDER